MRLNSKRRRRARKTLCLLAGVSAGVVVQANPQAPTVAAGNVTFTNPNATTLEIANSPNAIINWQSFDIGVGETTRFVQQSAASAVLNRVTTQNPSDILGNLVSNGRVFLVNPAGIVIGRDGLIDTAGLVLSTLNISNENFLAGRYEFNGDASSGQITNHGYIKTTPRGEIVLLAPRILNAPEAGNEKSGIIESENGELVLAAGYSITITSLDDPDISFEVTAPAGEVVNLGQLIARGGSVEILAETIHHSGEINADALSVDATGRIVLTATKSIETTATSVISARGERAVDPAATPDPEAPANPLGAAGGSVALKVVAPAAEEADATATPPAPTTATLAGRIDVTGARGGVARVEADTVTVRGTIDASGKTGGGTVQVLGDTVKAQGAILRANADVGDGGDIRFGGEFRGADTLRAADNATVDGASRFEANATTRGDGGEVVVWSNLETTFAGKAEARAGLEAGDGGMIEVSGKDILRFAGGVDVGAPRGDAGTLLLDPRNIVIVQGGATVSVDNPTPFANDGFGSSFSVLSNGNILVVNQNADASGLTDAGRITLLGPNGNLLGTIAGNATNERLGAFGSFTGPQGNLFFRSPNASNGGLANAGALIYFNITTGAEIGRSSGVSASELYGQGSVQFASGNLIVASTGADIGGNVDAGSVVVVSGATGTELGRLSGTSANEFFGTTVRVGFSAPNTFVVQSAGADVGGLVDAGRVVMGSVLTGQQLGQVVGLAAGDQIGSTVDYFSTGAGTYLIRSAVADVGGLTDAGTAILVNNATGNEIGRTSGLAAGDNLGTFAPILRGSGNYFLQVPNADVGSKTNAGSLVLVRGASGTRIGSVDGSGTGEQLGSNLNTFSLGGSDALLISALHDNPGIGAIDDTAGGVFVVADVDLGSGNILRGSTLGQSAGEQFGSNGIAAFLAGGMVIISENADTGGFTDNGSVV
ncbi:MAG: filamentous hemagglutinin N-terminal domain-containing protein, partial [Gammaproteobacteria bacterium]